MEFENIIALFSNLGVPVACLIAMFWLWNKEREDHKEAEHRMTEAINNNTIVMNNILEVLRKDED